MNADEIEGRLANIEKKLERKKRDIWDVLLGLGAVLIPAAIAVAGYLIGQGINEGQLRVAETNVKVEQSELIRKFMSSLTSANTDERALAAFAVIYAVPGYGTFMTREVETRDSDKSVRQSARFALDMRLSQLIGGLYADDSKVRVASAEEIVKWWYSDTALVSALLNYAGQNMGNENGIYNTVVILSSIDPNSLFKYEDDVKNFLDDARKVGPKTNKQIDQVFSILEKKQPLKTGR